MQKFSSILLLLGASTMVACTSGSSGSGSALSISGAMSLSSSTSSNVVRKGRTVNLTDYDVACATTTAPITTGTGSVAADGTFKVNMANAANQPISCYLVDANGDKVADFIISDSANKDLNGNDSTTTSATFDKSPDLGSISFDPDSGEVTVPATNISSFTADVSSTVDVFDPTGEWTIAELDFNPPGAIKPPCDPSDNECHGPPAGQTLYLKMWQGTVVADSSIVRGLQVWDSPGQFTSCGSKIGLTPTIKTSLGIDFSANGASDDVFTFTTSVASFADPISSVTGPVTLTDSWKMDTATMLHDHMPSCGPRDVVAGANTYANAWVCGPDLTPNYQAQLGGGCVANATGKNVDVRDWSGITSCSSVTVDGDGIRTNSCSGNTTIDGNLTAVTCSNKWAILDGTYTTLTSPGATFNWADLNASKISSGDPCSGISTADDAHRIAQLQCYSEYYYRSGMQDNSSICLPRVDTDWTATASADFVKVDLIRPQGLVFFEKFNPYPDGSGGSMTTRQEHYEGVQVQNSWVNCKVVEVGSLSIKKITASKMLATYQSSQITTSTSKPACLGKFNGTRETFVFYLTK